MSDFASIVSRVLLTVIDTPTSVQQQAPKLVQEAIKKLQTKHDFKVMEEETSVMVTSTGTRVLGAVPADFKKLRGLPYEIMQDGSTRELMDATTRIGVTRDYRDERGGEAITGELQGPPAAVLISEPTNDLGAMNFEIYPLPDGRSRYVNGQYRIVVPYWRYLPTLAAGTNWFTENAEEWIWCMASADAFFLDWDETNGTFWQTKASGHMKDVIKADKDFRLHTGVREIVPSPNAYGSRLRPAGNTTNWRGRRGL